MKGLISVLVIILFSAGGVIAFRFLKTPNTASETTSVQTGNANPQTNLTGILKKIKGDDYDYVLVSAEKSTGVASYSLDLGKFEEKKVEVSGQFSGTTLYADTVTEIP